MELMRRAIQTDPCTHTQDTYTHISPFLKQNISVQKSVGGHKDEIRACVLFELIPMGNWEQMKNRDRSGDLYL